MPLVRREIPLPGGAILTVEIDTRELDAELALRRRRLSDVAPLLSQVAALMRADLRRQFAQGGEPAWKGLSAATVARKTLQGLPARTAKGRVPWRLKQNGRFESTNILIATGRLRDSYGRKDSKDHFEEIDTKNATVRVGSKVEYAAAHQDGLPARTGQRRTKHGTTPVRLPALPARPLTVTDRCEQEIRGLVAAYFDAPALAQLPPVAE